MTPIPVSTAVDAFLQSATPAAMQSALTVPSVATTTPQPFTVNQTWNHASLQGVGLRVDITDTHSTNDSLLADFRVGGESRMVLAKPINAWGACLAWGKTSSFPALMDVGNNIIAVCDARMDGSGPRLNNASIAAGLGNGAGAGLRPGGVEIGCTGAVMWGTGGPMGQDVDTFLYRETPAVIQMGMDGNAPVNQTFKGCDGTGDNVAGASLTLAGGRGTGTGAGGKLVFKTAPAGSSGTTANALAAAMEIDGARVIGIKNTTAAPEGNPSAGGYLYVEDGALKFKGSGGTVTTLAPA